MTWEEITVKSTIKLDDILRTHLRLDRFHLLDLKTTVLKLIISQRRIVKDCTETLSEEKVNELCVAAQHTMPYW